MRGLAATLSAATDVDRDLRPALEAARRACKRIQPYDLVRLSPASRLTYYMFAQMLNGVWRTFGGDSNSGMPATSDHPLAARLLTVARELGAFLDLSLRDPDLGSAHPSALKHYESALSEYTVLLQSAEQRLLSQGE
jgi:hypothetical protein